TGCVNTQTLLVTVNPLPQLTTTSSVPAICIGDQVTLNATGASTYVWNPGNQSGASVIVSPTSTTTYTVTGTNALTGCVNTATLSVTVNPLPQLTLTSSVQAICIGDQVTLNASGASTYVWNPGALSGAVVNVSPAATTTYTVIGTNSLTGCIGTRTITVTVNSVPVVALGVDTTVCGGPYVLDAQNSGSAYLWSNNTTAQTLSVTTTGVYGVIVTDANGCSSEDSVSITINALPVVSLGADTSVCGPLVLNAGNVGSTYLWSSGDTSQTIAGSASGTYAVLVTNSLGCSSVDSVALTINPLPVVSLGNDISSCAVGPVTLDAGNVGMQYLWSSGNTSQTILVGIAGSYAVTVSDSLGCSATDSVNVSFTQLPTVTLGNDTSLCGGSLILDAGNTGSTYAWSNGDTTQTIVVIATALYGVTVTDSLGCSSTDSILVRVNTAPVIVFPLTQDTLCTLDTLFALTVSPAGGTFSGSFVTGSNFDPVASGVGTYTVYYTFTDTTTGCTSTDSATLVVDACTGIADNVFSETLFTVYPNPNNGFFNLALTNTSNREIRIQVYTVFGQVVYSDIASGLNGNLMRQIDLTNLANGAYYIRVTVGTTSQTMKVIKQD
ncbi:MAG: T9SS type A sorting domain-containing protein, partial [Bacteroidetes bacterium]|nr:T9SS type A sorting domain-containing protein [Bacteroidota bacterium]